LLNFTTVESTIQLESQKKASYSGKGRKHGKNPASWLTGELPTIDATGNIDATGLTA
jgi:hypothetical protein